jgi:hypothetical protein
VEIVSTNEGVVYIYAYDAGAEGDIRDLDDYGLGWTQHLDKVSAVITVVATPIMWILTPFFYDEKVGNQRRFAAIMYSPDDRVSYYEVNHYDDALTQKNIDAMTHEVAIRRNFHPRADQDALATSAHGDYPAAHPRIDVILLSPKASKSQQRRKQATTQNLDLAARLSRICQSAHGGYPAAQRRMGVFVLYPDNPKDQDLVKAYMWFRLAELREAKGSRSVAGVAGRMTPQQRVEADELVADWEPNPEECEVFGAKAEN